MLNDQDPASPDARRRRLLQGAAALPLAGIWPAPAARSRPPSVEHHPPGGDRHRGHGRSVALVDRHDGDLGDRRDPGRAARDRPDQRDGRPARTQDQGDQGGWRFRLADLRREGQEAVGERPCGMRVRLLDFGLAQGRAAGVREGERPALLPDLLRGPGAVEERLLHRPGSDPADPLQPRLGAEGEESQDLLPDRLGLHLAAHLDEDRAKAHRELPARQGRRRGVLPARLDELRFADEQDQGAEARLHLHGRGRRLERRVLQGPESRRHHRRQAASA